jgi:hypothetical protein
MHNNLTNFLDPIAKVWGNQQVLSQVASLTRVKIANEINDKKAKKIISKKGYQKSRFFTYISKGVNATPRKAQSLCKGL